MKICLTSRWKDLGLGFKESSNYLTIKTEGNCMEEMATKRIKQIIQIRTSDPEISFEN